MKQHAASMLIDQQQKPYETLQECVQWFSDILWKFSSLLLHQAKDPAHITHFIHNLHSQKLQHYVLSQNPTLIQNIINLAQKDTELHIIEGLHNHNPVHEINYISNNKQYHGKSSGLWPGHGCLGAHLIMDWKNSVCKKWTWTQVTMCQPGTQMGNLLPNNSNWLTSIVPVPILIGLTVTMTKHYNYLCPQPSQTTFQNFCKQLGKWHDTSKSLTKVADHTKIMVTIVIHINLKASKLPRWTCTQNTQQCQPC